MQNHQQQRENCHPCALVHETFENCVERVELDAQNDERRYDRADDEYTERGGNLVIQLIQIQTKYPKLLNFPFVSHGQRFAGMIQFSQKNV